MPKHAFVQHVRAASWSASHCEPKHVGHESVREILKRFALYCDKVSDVLSTAEHITFASAVSQAVASPYAQTSYYYYYSYRYL